MQQGTRGDGRRRGWRGAAAAAVAAMVASVVAVPAVADDDGIEVAGDPVAAQVWTTWVLDGVTLEGAAGDGVLDPARATVAAAAGIGVEDIEVEAVVRLTDGAEVIEVRAPDWTVFELPAGTQVDDVVSWTAEVRGLATSICAPTVQIDDRFAPGPYEDGALIFSLTVEVDCDPDREVTAERLWTINLPPGSLDQVGSVDIFDATGIAAELLPGFAFELEGPVQAGTVTTTATGATVQLRADTEVRSVTDPVDVEELIAGVDRCELTGSREQEIRSGSDGEGDVVAWFFWYDLDCTTTVELQTGWQIADDVVDPGPDPFAVVAAAAGVDPEGIAVTFELTYVPTLIEPHPGGGLSLPEGFLDEVTVIAARTSTSTTTQLTVPYGAELRDLTVEVTGFEDGICRPGSVALPPARALDHTYPDPRPENVWVADIRLECDPDIQVSVARVFTLNIDPFVAPEDREAEDPSYLDPSDASALLGVDAVGLLATPITLELTGFDGVTVDAEVDEGSGIVVRPDTEVDVRDEVDQLWADGARCTATSTPVIIPARSEDSGVASDLQVLVWWDLLCQERARVELGVDAGGPTVGDLVATVTEITYVTIDELGAEVGSETVDTPPAIGVEFDLPLRARVERIAVEVAGLVDAGCTLTSPLVVEDPVPMTDADAETTYRVPVAVECLEPEPEPDPEPEPEPEPDPEPEPEPEPDPEPEPEREPDPEPTTGSVTGGGWFTSPAGAVVADPARTGRASFGLTARLHPKDGTVRGNLAVRLPGRGLHLRSTELTRLTTDLTTSSAVVTGTGRLGKADGYGFTLEVVDGGSGGPDTLHLEIIAPDGTTVVYDPVAAVPLGGGNVTVHPPRGRLHAR